MVEPRVSFVIPAWNEEQQLPACLAAIRAAAEPLLGADGYEVIVVDDASTDRTGELALAAGALVVGVELHQISAVRNAGAFVARGERLVFVDADTFISKDLLEAAFEAMDQGAVGGGAPIEFDGDMPWMTSVFVWLTLVCFRMLTLAGGCFIFVKRSAFDAAGGFSEELYGTEEVAFAQQLKKLGRFVLLRVPVLSSARKMHQFTPWQLAKMSVFQLLRGKRAFRDRRGLDIWYGEQR